jgi:hypothetical protein
MKSSSKLGYAFFALSLFSALNFFSTSALAATCTANSDVSADCDGPLVVSSAQTDVTNSAGIASVDNYGINSSAAISGTLLNSSTGTVTVTNTTGASSFTYNPYGISLDGSSTTTNALTNSGTISVTNSSSYSTADNAAAIAAGIIQNSTNTLTTLTNDGTISVTGTSVATGNAYGITNFGTIGSTSCGTSADASGCSSAGLLLNSGSITVTNNGYGTTRGINNAYGGVIYRIDNTGTIDAYGNSNTTPTAPYGAYNAYAIYNHANSTSDGTLIGTINNSGTITADKFGIQNNQGTINYINNTGTIAITGTAIFDAVTTPGSENISAGIVNVLGTIGVITNSGTFIVSGDNRSGIINYGGAITEITNTGTIGASSTGGYSIVNTASIGTLNNSQSSLTYLGVLPTNYNIIITSPTHYGQLNVSSPSGTTTFGIYSGSTVRNGTYAAVISGLVSSGSYIAATTGIYGSGSWTLTEVDPTLGIWDLILAGFAPSTANTQASLANTASALQPIYTLQNTVLANSFSYDCSLFGKNGVCISAGGRNTAVQAANGLNNTSGLLIASYRLDKNNSRIGAYADQNLSVNNAGSTVNLGNNTPLMGLFGVWSQRPDAIGAEVKVSAAYGQKNTTITRQVVGDSEAGSGSSQLNSQGAQIVAKYGFGITENTVVSPYVGMRYTQNNMGGYTEGTSATVTAPLTYGALNTNATTLLAGLGARHRLTPKTMLFASAGVETDTNTANGSYYGTNSNIAGLTPVNFNANPVTTRPTASVGATYLIEKNQQLGLSGIYRQEPYQAVSTTSVFLTYTIGL